MNLTRLRNGLVRRINRFRPFRETTCAQLAAADASCWQEVYPAWQYDWRAPLPSGPLPDVLRERLAHTLPARGVLRLRNASVLGEPGWVFTADNRFVTDTSFLVDSPAGLSRVHQPLLRGGARRLRGRTFSLLSGWSACNFYHMLIDTLPRVDLLFSAGWSWSDFDHILLPAWTSPTIDRLLGVLDVPKDRTIPVRWGDLNYFRMDELVCTSFPGGRRTVLPEQVEYLRGLYARLPVIESDDGGSIAAALHGHGRRLFIKRRSRNRLLSNEAELLPVLEAHGFTGVDPSDLTNAEVTFHEADIIVGVHGAGLANIVFCRPGTKVLELIPSDQAYPYYYTTAVHGGFDYDCLIGRSETEQPRHPAATWNSQSDFTIDRAAFAVALDRLLSP